MNETTESPFPQTRQDLNDLKKTAVDAAKDLGSTAAVHAKKAQDNLQNLASHAQAESGEQLQQVKVRFSDLEDTFREYVSARPFACVGAALLLGFIYGVTRRKSRD